MKHEFNVLVDDMKKAYESTAFFFFRSIDTFIHYTRNPEVVRQPVDLDLQLIVRRNSEFYRTVVSYYSHDELMQAFEVFIASHCEVVVIGM